MTAAPLLKLENFKGKTFQMRHPLSNVESGPTPPVDSSGYPSARRSFRPPPVYSGGVLPYHNPSSFRFSCKELPVSELLETPLAAWHRAHGAKMAPFAGWDMPIQYEGILVEHNHTRAVASVFDICHMGQFVVRGEGAARLLALAVTHNLDSLKPGKCRYGFLLNPQSGVLDDLIIYRMGDDHFFLVVNAACAEGDFAVLSERLPGLVENISARSGKIDLQGPASVEVLEKLLGENFHDLGYFSFRETNFGGRPLLVSRTGYTGELGYELYPSREMTLPLWEALVADERVKPAGLGARDTLRLEVGLALYGHELDTEHTPAESGMGGMLASAVPYVGHEHAKDIRHQILLPLVLDGRRTARNGDAVTLPGEGGQSGEIVGRVTSGSFAPSLGHAVALAFVDKAHAAREDFALVVGKSVLPARRATLPFYTKGTARAKLQ